MVCKYFCFCGVILLFLVGPAVFGQEVHRDQDPTHDPIHHVHGSHPECPLPTRSTDILRCAQEEHPDVKRAMLTLGLNSTLRDVAQQIPNPEIEAQSALGNALGDGLMQTQVSLRQSVGLGGKRAAQTRKAEAKAKQSEADLRQVQAEITLRTVRNLHRLRQIESEKAILEEAITTYAKLVAQYRRRPRLTPDQEGSLLVYEIAQADNRVRLAAILEERRQLEHFFHVATGHGIGEIISVLPDAPKIWPIIDDKPRQRPPSPELFRLMAEREFTASQQDQARAESWPNLQIGPTVIVQSEGAIQSQLYGIHLVMDFPIFNLNSAGRAQAEKASDKVEKLISLLDMEESHERAEQVQIYHGAVMALKEAGSSNEVERKHARIEALSMHGLISSALVIEAHRQRAELEKNRNERELRAIAALWIVYKLDGRILQESL